MELLLRVEKAYLCIKVKENIITQKPLALVELSFEQLNNLYKKITDGVQSPYLFGVKTGVKQPEEANFENYLKETFNLSDALIGFNILAIYREEQLISLLIHKTMAEVHQFTYWSIEPEENFSLMVDVLNQYTQALLPKMACRTLLHPEDLNALKIFRRANFIPVNIKEVNFIDYIVLEKA